MLFIFQGTSCYVYQQPYTYLYLIFDIWSFIFKGTLFGA